MVSVIDTRWKWQTKFATVTALWVALATLHFASAFDITNMTPLANGNLRNGNKVLNANGNLYGERQAAMANYGSENENEYADGDDGGNDDDGNGDDDIDDDDNTDGKVHNDSILDDNEIPIRYDEAQLWRIYNISDAMRHANQMPLADILENRYGGTIWKENSKFLDISFTREHLKEARGFLDKHNLKADVLNSNIQELIDNETMMGINMTQSEKGQRTKKAARSGINWKDYHDLETIYAFMREIRGKFPNICRLYTIGKTAEGRDLKVLRISENPSEYKKIWIDGGVHAREWITPATVTYILKRLMSNWEELPNYLSNKTWYFMPMVNPDGYEYSRRVDRLWRKNRSPNKHSKCKGVDINRNFNIGWNTQGSSANPCRETYHGPAPMSELETEAIVTFLKERKSNLEAFLTFHSYGQMILYPWGHKSSTLKSAPLLQGLGNKVAQLMRKATGKYYQVGNRHKLLPPAGGGADDWACSTLGTTFMYTIELRDRGNYGFVLPARQILGTAVEGYIMVDVVAQHIQ